MTSINNENKLTQIKEQKEQKKQREETNPLLEIFFAIQKQVATEKQESIIPEHNATKTKLETTIAGVTKTIEKNTQKNLEEQVKKKEDKDSVLEAWTKKDATV